MRASELLDYTNYEGDYEFEMGIGKPPEHQADAGEPDILDLRLGRNGSDDRARRGHHARRDHHHLGQVGDARPSARPPRASSRRATSPPSGSPSTASTRARPASSSSTSTASATTPRPTGRRATRTTSTASTSRARRASSRRRRSGSPTVRAATPPPPAAWRPGMRALNAVPAVNDLPPGWVTALDLPLIAGVGHDSLSTPATDRVDDRAG